MITIVLPTYNRADDLPRAIDSALDQTLEDFELVVVDDGSTDHTRSVVEGYEDDRITYIAHDENRGVSAARNTGIAAATGDYVTFLDSDDEFEPTFLETSIETLEAHPEECAGTCVTQRMIFDDGTVRNPVPSSTIRMNVFEYHDSASIPRAGGLTLRSSAISEVGTFDARLPCHEDVDYWLRLFDEGYYLVGINEPLYRYYQHEGQHATDYETVIAGLEHFFEKHTDSLPKGYRVRHRSMLGKYYARDGEFSEAARQFARAIELNPVPSRNFWYYVSARAVPQVIFVPDRVGVGIKKLVRYKHVKRRLKKYVVLSLPEPVKDHIKSTLPENMKKYSRDHADR